MGTCTVCGQNAGLMMSMCPPCIEASAARVRAGEEAVADTKAQFEAQLAQVTLTTAQTLEGHRLVRTVEVITAECVFGINIFRDFFAAISDVVGGRSEASQVVLRDARKACLRELRHEAHKLGANAVIAVDLDYSEISGGGKSMLFLVASGTAVMVEPLQVAV